MDVLCTPLSHTNVYTLATPLLQMDSELTLEKAMKTVRQNTAVKEQHGCRAN